MATTDTEASGSDMEFVAAARTAVPALLAEREHKGVYAEIQAERARQDAQWGGPSHDDQHQNEDWRIFRERFEEKALFSGTVANRKALVAIAALAVAQIESMDRLSSSPSDHP